LPVGGLKGDMNTITWSGGHAIDRRFQAKHDI
jgi:hypothetical protein